MAAVSKIFTRLRPFAQAAVTQAEAPAQDTAARSPEHMIASCEYELRQLRRDVLQTRQRTVAQTAPTPREPFFMRESEPRGRTSR